MECFAIKSSVLSDGSSIHIRYAVQLVPCKLCILTDVNDHLI